MAAASNPAGRRAVALAALLVLLTLPAVTTRFYANDEVEYYAWLRSAAFDRDADFENEYTHFYESGAMRNAGFHETFLERINEAGRRYNFAPIGTAVLWAPFFAAGHAAALLSGAPADGYSAPYITAVTWGSAWYGWLALVLTAAMLRRLVGHGLGTALLVCLGTPLVFYMYVAPGFSHACSALAVSLFLYVWLRVRDRWSPAGMVALGLAGGLMAMVREQDAFFLAGPALDYLRALRLATAPQRFMAAAAGAAAFLLAYAPQLVAYTVLNGHPGPTTAVVRKMSWTSPHFLEVLLSPQHGLFFWTPLALAGLAGLIWLAAAAGSSDLRWIAALAIVMWLLQVYVSGCVESWTVAGSFGQRRFVALTPLVALGLAALTAALRRRTAARAAWAAVLALCLWWNVGLIAQFGLHTMDRQRLSLRDNARATFLELPATLPSLAWRYFADRSSFYGLPQR
ncbi:MAG: hypothetical protein IT184_16355 [Acidobacteria bacterium]|nr:hypothetical protein [Acidobacteriota bacterium]